MKIHFDDAVWQRLQDDLGVGLLCGEAAGKVYGHAKAAVQQAAALVGEGEASSEDVLHVLGLLRALRNNAGDAAQRFAAAAAALDAMAEQFAPPSAKAPRRRGPGV